MDRNTSRADSPGRAGLRPESVEVLFTGWDQGIDLGVEHAFERSLPLADALRPDVMLAWAANGSPLLPQHGFPLRLIVPTWYGMASVKWLRAITVLNGPFLGLEQSKVYRYKQSETEIGLPVREKRVNSILKPPGIPDLLSRYRFLSPGLTTIQGMAWSGFGSIVSVVVSLGDMDGSAASTYLPQLLGLDSVVRTTYDPRRKLVFAMPRHRFGRQSTATPSGRHLELPGGRDQRNRTFTTRRARRVQQGDHHSTLHATNRRSWRYVATHTRCGRCESSCLT